MYYSIYTMCTITKTVQKKVHKIKKSSAMYNLRGHEEMYRGEAVAHEDPIRFGQSRGLLCRY